MMVIYLVIHVSNYGKDKDEGVEQVNFNQRTKMTQEIGVGFYQKSVSPGQGTWNWTTHLTWLIKKQTIG